MKLGPDAWCFFAEGKVDQLELGWYLYVYDKCLYVYYMIAGKHDWSFLYSWFVVTLWMQMICACLNAKTFVCYEQLYCCRIIGLILGGPWCNICKLAKHRSQPFFRPVQKNITMVFTGAIEDTIDLINSIQILQSFISFLGKNQAFGAFTMWGVLVIVDNICIHLYIYIYILYDTFICCSRDWFNRTFHWLKYVNHPVSPPSMFSEQPSWWSWKYVCMPLL